MEGAASDETTKLVEEAKLYWAVQSLVAPAAGYLLSHLTTTNRLQDAVFCVLALAFVPIVVGTVYNIAGAGYIYEARVRAQLPISRDFFCGWMAIAYLIVGGLVVSLLADAVGAYLRERPPGHHAPLAFLLGGFVIGLAIIWLITRSTYTRVRAECARHQEIIDFGLYLENVERLCDWEPWQIAIALFLLIASMMLIANVVSGLRTAPAQASRAASVVAPLRERQRSAETREICLFISSSASEEIGVIL
jgi:hypothetical protein